jgi:hypothetical protein
VFGGDAFDAARFETLREQADAHGAADPTALLMLSAAGTLLRELLPEAEESTSHRDVVSQTAALLFHGFRFWLHGGATFSLGETSLRALLSSTDPVGEWQLRTPAPAGYLQLPRNLLWARVAEDGPAEPLDGFFWSMPTEDEMQRGERLDLLLCLGVRAGRPGLSLVDVSVESAEPLQHWGDAQARPDGDDFANILPGGELQRYHGLMMQAEVLKLAARCFHYLDRSGPAADG